MNGKREVSDSPGYGEWPPPVASIGRVSGLVISRIGNIECY